MKKHSRNLSSVSFFLPTDCSSSVTCSPERAEVSVKYKPLLLARLCPSWRKKSELLITELDCLYMWLCAGNKITGACLSLSVYLQWHLPIVSQVSFVAYQPYNSRSWYVLFLELFEPHLSSDKCFLWWHKHAQEQDIKRKPVEINHFIVRCVFVLPFAWYHRPKVLRGLPCSTAEWRCGIFPGLPCPRFQSEEWHYSDAPTGWGKHLEE